MGPFAIRRICRHTRTQTPRVSHRQHHLRLECVGSVLRHEHVVFDSCTRFRAILDGAHSGFWCCSVAGDAGTQSPRFGFAPARATGAPAPKRSQFRSFIKARGKWLETSRLDVLRPLGRNTRKEPCGQPCCTFTRQRMAFGGSPLDIALDCAVWLRVGHPSPGTGFVCQSHCTHLKPKKLHVGPAREHLARRQLPSTRRTCLLATTPHSCLTQGEQPHEQLRIHLHFCAQWQSSDRDRS